MGRHSFLKAFSSQVVLVIVIGAVGTPFLYSQIQSVIFDINLENNREQAERIATLASIDLENGVPHESVLNKMQQMLESTPQSEAHFVCIIEHPNKVIAHPKRSNINKDVTGWIMDNGIETKEFTQSAGEGVPFGGVQTRLDGSQDINYQIPISTQPWSVSVHTKLDIIEDRSVLVLKQIGLIVLPALLLVILFSSFMISKRKE